MLKGIFAKQNTSKYVINFNQSWMHLKTWFFLLPAFKLAITEKYPIIDRIFILWAILALLLLVVVSAFHGKVEKKAVVYALCLGIFCMIYAAMTKVYTPRAFLGSLSQSVRMLLFPFFLLAYRDIDYKQILYCISAPWKIILLLDAISIFIDYDGKREYSLLGLDNTVIFVIIPLLTIILLNDYIKYGKFSTSSIAVFGLCVIGKLYSHAVSACIALAVFIIAYYVILNKKKSVLVPLAKRVLNPTIMFGFFVSFTALILLFNITPFFVKLFSIFGKNGTMTGRTRIWVLTANSILKHPILGHGQAAPVYFQSFVGLSIWDKAATHSHNFALELLWSTGIIGTFLYVYLFIKAMKMLYKYREFMEVKLLSCGFTAFSVLMITDSYIMQPAFMTLCFLCLNIEKILIRKDTNDS